MKSWEKGGQKEAARVLIIKVIKVMKHLLHLSPVIFKAQLRISGSLSVALSSSNFDIAP